MIGLAATSTHAADPATGGFIPFDVDTERVVVGALPVPDAVRVESAHVAVRGTFIAGDSGLTFEAPAPYGESTWIASGASFTSGADGLVRARFAVGAALDATVLVGAETAPDGELLRAIGVSVERGIVRLVRYQDRNARSLGSEARMEPLAPETEVEVVVVCAGGAVMASVYDGATLRLLAHVSARAPRTAGAVGVRVHKAHSRDSRVVFVSVSPLDVAQAIGARDDEVGDARLVKVARERLAAVPGDLRARIVHSPWLPADDHVRIHTDVIGAERLRRLGLAAAVSARVPWGVVEPSLSRVRGPLGTSARGLRVDTGYKSVDDVEQTLRAYADRFPARARLEAIGTTVQGRTLWALRISDDVGANRGKPTVMLNGAHHAGELMATEAVLDAVHQLLEGADTDPALRRMLEGLVVVCVPLVNPDGLDRFLTVDRNDDRKNARGVDLYRNYPVRWGGLGEGGSRSFPESSRFRGPSAGSEAETQAMMALAERERFVASIDFHTNGTVVLAPYTDPSLRSPDDNEAWRVAEELVSGLPRQQNGKRYVVQQNLYPVDGTAQDWLRFTHGTVALLVEMPVHNPIPYARGRADLAAVRLIWRRLFARVLDGPRVVGRVVDELGAPVAAEIVVHGLEPRSGEVWTARPRDGRFFRLLPRDGSVRVTVRAPGFTSVTVDKPAQPRGASVEIVLVRPP